MNTENDTILTDSPIIRRRTPSECLAADIIDEMKTRSRDVDIYKNDKTEKFIDLRARGASYQDIAEILHCSKSTLVNWNKELAAEIAERKAMTKNDILQSYQVARDNRLRYFSELYREIRDELARRNLRDISSDKLYAMLEKCSKHIDELSGEKREETQNMSMMSAMRIETVQTAVKCVKRA
ncbi:MAG: helix-turn-helix domain-containing protein [Candidatus Saccharibacteria bacterium]|nr:helix-turn-helix domain-containing protein [Candidatus Saccharibacteria bacterium]